MKTPKNAATSSLPVSKKAYTGFTDRIRQVYASDASRSALMIDVLDRYLDGDKDASDSLDEHMRLAFEFLRHDVDLAIERSRRARERARARRAHHTAENTHDPSPTLMRPDTDTLASRKQMDDVTFAQKIDECLKKYFTIVEDEPEDDEEEEEPFDRPLTRRERRARERAARGKSRIKPLCARVG